MAQVKLEQIAQWYQEYSDVVKGDIIMLLYCKRPVYAIRLYRSFIATDVFKAWEDVNKNYIRVSEKINEYLAKPNVLGAFVKKTADIFADQYRYNKIFTILYMYARVLEQWDKSYSEDVSEILYTDSLEIPNEFERAISLVKPEFDVTVDVKKYFDLHNIYTLRKTEVYQYIIHYLFEVDRVESETQVEGLVKLNKQVWQTLVDGTEEYEHKLKAVEKQRDEFKHKCKELSESIYQVEMLQTQLEKKDMELYQLTMQNNTLQDKLALLEYEFDVTEDEILIKEEEIAELSKDIRLSDYKILLITDRSHSSKFSIESIDINYKVDRVSRIDYADIIVFDTRHNSHHAYWTAKERCKAQGKYFMHFNNSPCNLEKEVRKFILMHVL